MMSFCKNLEAGLQDNSKWKTRKSTLLVEFVHKNGTQMNISKEEKMYSSTSFFFLSKFLAEKKIFKKKSFEKKNKWQKIAS